MPVDAKYSEQIAAGQLYEQKLLVWDRRLTHLRAAAFLLVLVTAGAAWTLNWGAAGYTAAGLVFAGFVCLVAVHDELARRLKQLRVERQLAEEGLARRGRHWSRLPSGDISLPPSHQALANDLDLFGTASLFQLVCVKGTELGRAKLRDWLLEPASVAELRSRQEAVRELVACGEVRERLQLSARLLESSRAGPDRLITWAETPPWLESRPWLLIIARILPFLVAGSLLLTVAGVLSPQTGGLLAAGLLLFSALGSVLFVGHVHDLFLNVSTRHNEAARYLALFQLFYEVPVTTPELADLQKELSSRGGGVIQQLTRLNRIMRLANISQSPLLFLLVYVPLQIVTLWDIHVLWWLERWQRQCGSSVRVWFDIFSQFEALCSLATLSYENPTWSFPHFEEPLDVLSAIGLGHPLLADEVRVENDVEVGPPGTFLLVTGSNMSGKSTLLRAIGANIVLAQAGGPVCAEQMTLPPLHVATSMRIHDSLADGVSLFMAELQRLKEIVDTAHQHATDPSRRLLYLLDEILQGTNSRERHIAVTRVLEHLLQCEAIGAISSHDLELASDPPLAAACHAVHFRELVHGGESPQGITFDYLLRPGVATTTNALKLLEIVGLQAARR